MRMQIDCVSPFPVVVKNTSFKLIVSTLIFKVYRVAEKLI